MSVHKPAPGTLIDDGDEDVGLVIDPLWTDEAIAAALRRYRDEGYFDNDVVFTRHQYYAHSARQLRDDPQPYDSWWSPEGELKTSIWVAEVQS